MPMQKLLIVTNSTASTRILLLIKTWYLSFLMPVLKIMLLLQSYIFIEVKKLSPKLFIIQ